MKLNLRAGLAIGIVLVLGFFAVANFVPPATRAASPLPGSSTTSIDGSNTLLPERVASAFTVRLRSAAAIFAVAVAWASRATSGVITQIVRRMA